MITERSFVGNCMEIRQERGREFIHSEFHYQIKRKGGEKKGNSPPSEFIIRLNPSTISVSNPKFLKILFIYSLETPREKQRQGKGRNRLPGGGRDAGLNPRTRGSHREQKADTPTTEPPRHFSNSKLLMVFYFPLFCFHDHL